MAEFVTQVLEQDHNQQAFGILLSRVQGTFILTLGFECGIGREKKLEEYDLYQDEESNNYYVV